MVSSGPGALLISDPEENEEALETGKRAGGVETTIVVDETAPEEDALDEDTPALDEPADNERLMTVDDKVAEEEPPDEEVADEDGADEDAADEEGALDAAPDDADEDGVEAEVVSVSVTGQIVVETGIITVVTIVERAGQSVTSGPHEIMVAVEVENTVDVVNNVVDGENSSVETGGLLAELDEIGVLLTVVLPAGLL